MTAKNLLVELFVEELPPKALKKLGDAFATALAASLGKDGLATADAKVTAYASPRRLAAHVTGVLAVAADKAVVQKLMPVAVGQRLTVVGMGVAVRGDGRSGGVARAASLSVTGRPGTLQIRLVDPSTNNTRAGLGACTGDSGAPAFLDSNGGSVIVGVVSWSTGPNNASGCGGLTGVTPLALYRDWILKTVRSWGAGI